MEIFFFSSFFVVNSVSFHFNWILSPIQKSEVQYFETQNHEPGFPMTSFCSKYKSGLKQHKDTQHHRNSFFCMCWDRRWTIVLRFLVIIWHVYKRNLFFWKTSVHLRLPRPQRASQTKTTRPAWIFVDS